MAGLLHHKKGMNISETWVEWSSLGIIILALLLSLVSRNTIVTYLIILASGMIMGRMFYMKRYQPRLIFSLFALAFLIGFVVGSFIRGLGSARVIVVIYLIGIYVGYFLHKQGYLW
ncbi:hypothetical protein HYY69_08320 [Candidatus Woesearchaeota archaeon]|nr:hypothetical protein [Candidatus Woesearchaeota archaeon]